MRVKKKVNRFFLGALLCLIVGSSLSSLGCTVYTNGMTLPNPHYMGNKVQYFPSGPEFPFAREVANMQAVEPDQF